MARAPRIAIDLEANVAGLIGDMRVASQSVTRFTTGVQRDMKVATAQVEQLGKAVAATGTFLRTSFAGIGTTTLLSTLTGLSDRYQNLDAKLKLVSRSHAEYKIAQEGTRKIAKETYTSLESTVALYQRVSNSVEGLGIKQSQVLKITDTINKAFLVSGATSEEASASIIQLTQSFGSGFLRGQEFNSIAEQAPRLLKAIAQTMDVPRGALKSLANDGKITTKVLIDSFTGLASESIAEEATKIPLTINRAFGLLRNSALVFVGEAAKTSGAAADMAGSLKFVADNFEAIADGVVMLTKSGLIIWLARATSVFQGFVAAQVSGYIKSAAAASAYQEMSLAVAATEARKVEAMLASQKAQQTYLAQTQAALVVAREESIAKLAAANASIHRAEVTIRESEATIAATAAIGAMSGALRAAAVAEEQLAAAQAARGASTAARAAALADLATLGAQQARLSREALGASPGRFSQAEIAAANVGMANLVANGTKLTTVGGAITGALSKAGAALTAFIGGPVGVAVIAVAGLYMAFSHLSEQMAAAKQTAKDFKDSLEEVTKTASYMTQHPESGSAATWIESYLGSSVTINEKRAQIKAVEEDLARLQRSLGSGGSEGRDLAIIGQIEGVTASLNRMKAEFQPAQAAFASMGDELRSRLGPSFDSVRKAAQTMNETNFQKFLDALDPVVKRAITQLDALQKKLLGVANALPETVLEMQRKLRDTGKSAKDTATNHILDLIDDGRRAGMSADYFKQIEQSAGAYIRTAIAQEQADKRNAEAKRERSAAARELSASEKKAAADTAFASNYLEQLKAKNEELNIENLTGRELNETRKEMIKFDYMLTTSRGAALKAIEPQIRAQLEENAAIQEGIEARARQQEAMKREIQLRRQIQDYVDARAQASQREIDAIEHGGYTAELNTRLQAVTDEFRDQRRQLEETYSTQLNSIPLTEMTRRNELQEDYTRLLGISVSAEAVAMAKEKEYLDARIAAQADWSNGARSAFEDYIAQASNVAGQTKDIFARAFGGLEDLIVQFATTGKASFRQFTISVLTDFVRMETRIAMSKIFSWLLNSIGGAFMPGASAGPNFGIPALGEHVFGFHAKGAVYNQGVNTNFAKGGAFTNSIANRATTVPMATFGEAGEEAIMPLARDSSGKLGVTAQSAGASSMVVNATTVVNIDNSGNAQTSTESDAEDARNLARLIDAKVQEGIKEASRPGGQIYNMRRGAHA